MTRDGVIRITKATTPQTGGQILAKGFVSRADATVQQKAAKQGKSKSRYAGEPGAGQFAASCR